ncbi:MAG TPA: hypothetical protein VE890_08895, partial [Thermoguttaceae bacterium]|nr:hypothetical protein [Thermoguttaceae bacterium]
MHKCCHRRPFASTRERLSNRRYRPPIAKKLAFESLERRTLLTVEIVPIAAGIANLSANTGDDTGAEIDGGRVAWFGEDGLYFHDGTNSLRIADPSGFFQLDAGNLAWFGL